MLNRTFIFLLISSFLFNINAQTEQGLLGDKILEGYNNSLPESFFSTGILQISNNKETPFLIYIEQNKYFSDLSITIEESTIKYKSEEYLDYYNKDDKEINSDDKILNSSIPIELINYPLRNRTSRLLEKSTFFKYKNLNANKIELIDNFSEPELLIEEEVLENFPEQELLIKEDLTSEETEENSNDENIASTIVEVSSVIEDETTVDSSIDEKNKFEKSSFEKIIIIVSDISNIVLRKEFYINESDINPTYIYDVDNIKYIAGYYIPVEWSLKERNSNSGIVFKYNPKSITYIKEDIPNKFNKLTNFNGVK